MRPAVIHVTTGNTIYTLRWISNIRVACFKFIKVPGSDVYSIFHFKFYLWKFLFCMDNFNKTIVLSCLKSQRFHSNESRYQEPSPGLNPGCEKSVKYNNEAEFKMTYWLHLLNYLIIQVCIQGNEILGKHLPHVCRDVCPRCSYQ